jgi:hypothetical protein
MKIEKAKHKRMTKIAPLNPKSMLSFSKVLAGY